MKKKLIIVWLAANAIALFVNYYGIDSKIEFGKDANYNVGGTAKEIYLFTDSYDIDINEGSDFWPFIKFTEKKTYFASGYPGQYKPYSSFTFRGLFPDYDYSEFIAYLIITILVVYFSKEKIFNFSKQ